MKTKERRNSTTLNLNENTFVDVIINNVVTYGENKIKIKRTNIKYIVFMWTNFFLTNFHLILIIYVLTLVYGVRSNLTRCYRINLNNFITLFLCLVVIAFLTKREYYLLTNANFKIPTVTRYIKSLFYLYARSRKMFFYDFISKYYTIENKCNCHKNHTKSSSNSFPSFSLSRLVNENYAIVLYVIKI